MKETQKSKQNKLELKKNIIEVKQEKGLLNDKQKKEIELLSRKRGDLNIYNNNTK